MGDFALTKEERKALLDENQQRRVAEMYLDLYQKWTIPQMAEELGLTVRQVEYLTSKQSFAEIYSETLATVTGRARLAVIHDMQATALESAYRAHLKLIEGSSAAVQLSAIRLLYQVLHLDVADSGARDDRDELRDWQEKLGKQFNIGEVNVFMNALDRTVPLEEAPQIVDGVIRDVTGDPVGTVYPGEDTEHTPH